MSGDELRSGPPLEPCPFCGGHASYGKITYGPGTVEDNGWEQDTFWYAHCEWCGTSNQGSVAGHKNKERAAEHWNRREVYAPAFARERS